MVALEDYEALKETAHLLRNPANARRLLGSIERLEAGGGSAACITNERNRRGARTVIPGMGRQQEYLDADRVG